jgi:putative membrane protein
LVFGYRRIRLGDRRGHHRAMLWALALAAAFLVLYLAKAALYPPARYAGPAAGRPFYLALLAFHTAIAALNLPLALVTLFFALSGRFERHRPWARRTFWVWIAVALTGWAVYGVLLFWGR